LAQASSFDEAKDVTRRSPMLKQVTVGATVLVLSLGGADAQQVGQARIPIPSASLLKQQPEPLCEYRPSEKSETRALDSSKGGDPAADAAALRTKLDYERQCYRHAEMIARQRLHALQASVGTTISAIQRAAKRTQ